MKEYIQLVLRDSDVTMDNQDTLLYAQMSVDSAMHEFDISFKPDSSVLFDSDTNTQTLGISFYEKNKYGGKIYGGVNTGRTYSYGESYYSSSIYTGYSQSILRELGSKYNTLKLFSAYENLKVTKEKINSAKMELVIDAVNNYYSVIINKKKKEIYKKSLERAEYNYNAAKSKNDAGIVSKIDVYRAETAYLDSKQSYKLAATNYDNAMETAKILVSRDLENPMKFKEEIYLFQEKIEKNNIEKQIEGRAEWKDILMQEKVLERRYYNAYRSLFPDIYIDVSYNLSNDANDYSDSWNVGRQKEWKVMLRSDYTLDNFNNKQELSNIKIQKNKIIRDKRNLKRLIYKEINDNFNAMENEEYTVNIQKRKMENAKQALQVANIRYERGLEDNLAVIEAETNLLNSEVSYYSAIKSYNVSMLRLAKSMNKMDMNFVYSVIDNAKEIK